MKEHNWIMREAYAGPIGGYDYWECSECGACGGCVWNYNPITPPTKAYYPENLALYLADDCEISAAIIKKYENNKNTTTGI